MCLPHQHNCIIFMHKCAGLPRLELPFSLKLDWKLNKYKQPMDTICKPLPAGLKLRTPGVSICLKPIRDCRLGAQWPTPSRNMDVQTRFEITNAFSIHRKESYQ